MYEFVQFSRDNTASTVLVRNNSRIDLSLNVVHEKFTYVLIQMIHTRYQMLQYYKVRDII